MKRMTFIIAAFVLSVSVYAQTWTVDKAHSRLGFGITHMNISEINGYFKSFDSKITSAKDDFSDASVELTADATSINTDNEQRNNHLKSADFFDVAQYPTITFKSSSISKVGDNTYKVSGNLTMHGVTKPVVLDATMKGPITHPMSKKSVVGVKISGNIKRTDFGIGPKFASNMLSDEVPLMINTEFVKD